MAASRSTNCPIITIVDVERFAHDRSESRLSSAIRCAFLGFVRGARVRREHDHRNPAHAAVQLRGHRPGVRVVDRGRAVEEHHVGLQPPDRSEQRLVLELVQARDLVPLIGQDRLDDLSDIAVVVDAQDAGDAVRRPVR